MSEETRYLLSLRAGSILDIIGVSEKDVVVVISDEICLHLKDLNIAHLLHVKAYFKALYFGISFKLTCFEKF